MEKIETAGKSKKTVFAYSHSWYSNLNPNSTYFAYPGDYKDDATGKLYYCKTVIVFPNYHCISDKQVGQFFNNFIPFQLTTIFIEIMLPVFRYFQISTEWVGRTTGQ